MAKKKSSVNVLDQISFSDFEQENVNFPVLCKFIRTALDVTQLQMAQKLGITLRAYTFWEEGKRAPRGWQAMKLCVMYFYAKEIDAKNLLSKEQPETDTFSQEENPQNQAA